MQVRSLRNHPYGGSIHPKGSTYEITSKSHIRILTAVKAIERVPQSVRTSETVTGSKNMAAEKGKPEPVQRRKYRRRESNAYGRKDMQAKSPSSE